MRYVCLLVVAAAFSNADPRTNSERIVEDLHAGGDAWAFVQDPPTPPVPPTIKLEPLYKGDVGFEILIEAKTNGKTVSWLAPDERLRVLPTCEKGMRVNVISATPGKYKLIAVTAIGDVISPFAEAWVTIGTPVPGPGPGPTPPGPGPTPPPDTLAVKLQAAYDADPDSGELKRSKKILLWSVYASMADHMKKGSEKTVAEMLAKLKTLADGQLPKGGLTGCRKALAELLAEKFPDPAAALTDESRAAATAVFLTIAKVLDELKG